MAAIFTPIVPISPMEFSESAKPVEGGGNGTDSAMPFQNILRDSFLELEQAEKTASDDSVRLALGNADDLAQIQINALKAQAAVQTTVQLTTRVVNAYKEIMQMQL